MVSNWQRRKGRRGENEVVSIALEHDLPARRISRLGCPDQDVLICNELHEVKCGNAYAMKRLRSFIDNNFAVVHRADREDWLVTLRLADYLELMKAHEKERSDDASM